MSLPPWYTVKQAAKELGIAKRTMRKYISLGKIKAHMVGKTYIVPWGEVEKWRKNGKGTDEDVD